MHAFLVSSIALAVAMCALGLLLARLPRVSASTRHWLLSASLLVPCIAIAAAAFDPPNPFARGETPASVDVAITQVATATAAPARTTQLPLYVWIAGTLLFLTSTLRSLLRWTRIAKRATPFHFAGFDQSRVRLAVSPAASEPMVVGVFRPVVLLPVGYAGDLDARALASVFAHELAHVERRDNATALLHELVCALFWFDPLHWLARKRLLDLRERACDERVLDLGCDADSYLDALARSCHAAVDAPAVACMSGFHVRERMDSIMTYASARSRFVSSALVRATALTLATAVAAAFALFAPAPPAFAASRADRYTFDVSLRYEGANRIAHVVVRAPDGDVVADSQVTTPVNGPVEISSTHGRRAVRVCIDSRANGGMIAVLEIKEGEQLVQRDEQEIGDDILTPAAVPAVDTASPADEAAAARPPYRVGGDIKAPKVVSHANPIYPGAAKEAGITGIVIVEALIDETGVVTNARVLKSLPMGLDQAAVDAVKQWRFEPATKDGKPVPVIFNLTINFRLD